MLEIAALRGCRVQRIDGPRADLFALTLHGAGRHGVLVLALERDRIDWGWVEERPRGDIASAFVLLMRKHLENARVERVAVGPGGVVIELARESARLILATDPPNLVVELASKVVGACFVGSLGDAGAAVGRPFPARDLATPAIAATFEALLEHGPAVVARRLESELAARRRTLGKATKRRVAQLDRRLTKIEGDLDRAGLIEGLRHHASLLLAGLGSIPPGATVAEVVDWLADPPSPIRIPIPASRTAREEADALFARARKLERGGKIALDRRTATSSQAEHLRALLPRIEVASAQELDELASDAGRLGVRVEAGPRGADDTERRRAHRSFSGTRGRTILVGRGAEGNDALTLAARAWHHWLHARDVTGSHVVIPLERGEACPPELLVDAAHLAAHFSSARGEPRVDVQHCARRHVRKTKGAPAGAVLVEREKVISLRLEPERLARLLATERP